jgi:putative OPT family oligopeptide transporter
MPMPWVGAAVVVAIVPLYFLYHLFVGSAAVSLTMAVIMVGAGFVFSAVSGYMTGLVGSSNNPISGVTIATLLFASLLLLAIVGGGDARGPAAAILIGAVVACAAAIAGDNLHDLKTGHLVGATPWKQQVMLIVGTLTSAFVMAPVLNLLLAAYGIGAATPEHPQALTAPQATLMASVARGVFEGGLPWGMVGMGAALGVAIILIDVWLERRHATFRAPVLAVAVGIYLPFELATPIMIGGLTSYFVHRTARRRAAAAASTETDAAERTRAVEQRGLLLASGLITGEALVGIAMAIPIVIASRADVLAFWGVHDATWPGLVLLAAIVAALYRLSVRA